MLKAVIKEKDMNITCGSILGYIWSLEEKYFVAKEVKVLKQWVIYKIPYNLCFCKWQSDFFLLETNICEVLFTYFT